MEITLTIGHNCEIYSYSTKQAGYGRQHLYVQLKRNDIPFSMDKSFIKDVYVCDVFPNVSEHFDFILEQDAFYNEEEEFYTDGNGNGEYEEAFATTVEALNSVLEGRDFDIEMPDVYVIAWEENTFTTKYYMASESNGTTICEHADEFETEKEAQELIDANSWINCYVTTKD